MLKGSKFLNLDMNSFVLMAEVLTEPELRRTPDNQSAIASFLVQFPSQRPEDPVNRLKVSGWNTLADQIMEQYHKGDRVVIEGKLQMSTLDRNGYKEKRAELVAQRIHALGNSPLSNTESTSGVPVAQAAKSTKASTFPTPGDVVKADPEPSFDNIPF
jgi:single-strand DNA-binding protein